MTSNIVTEKPKHINMGYDNLGRRIIKTKTKKGKIIYKAQLPSGAFITIHNFK